MQVEASDMHPSYGHQQQPPPPAPGHENANLFAQQGGADESSMNSMDFHHYHHHGHGHNPDLQHYPSSHHHHGLRLDEDNDQATNEAVSEAARAAATALAAVEHHGAPSPSTSSTAATPQSPSQAPNQASPFSRHLGRNRACASCRDRKLKCDGARPICGQCSRAWNSRRKALMTKGKATEGDLRDFERPCSYLDVPPKHERGGRPTRSTKGKGRDKGGLEPNKASTSLTPLEEAERERKRLEREVAELRSKLTTRGSKGMNTSQMQSMHQNGGPVPPNFHPNSDELSIAEMLASTMRGPGEGYGGQDTSAATTPSRSAAERSLGSFVGSLTGASGAQMAQHLANANHQVYPHPISFSSTSSSGPIDPLLLGSDTTHHQPEKSNGDARSMDATASAAIAAAAAQAAAHSNASAPQPDPLLELVFSGWPSDFPPPAMVHQLVHIYFDNFDWLCLMQPARFFDNLSHGPTSPKYPHPAILHVIFSMAYSIRPDLDPFTAPAWQVAQHKTQRASALAEIRRQHTYETPHEDPALQKGAQVGIQMAMDSREDKDKARAGSAGYHSDRAQHHIMMGTWEGGNLMDILRATLLFCNKKYLSGELFEAWMSSSNASRLCIALALNRSKSQVENPRKMPIVDTIRLSMAGPPLDWIDEEERRRLMFFAFITDRTASSSTLWASSLEDADVTVELPMCSDEDFINSNSQGVAFGKKQTLQSSDLFTSNHIDPANCMLKGFILWGRCGSFISRLPPGATEEDVRTPAFYRLNNLISAYTMSIPTDYKTSIYGGNRKVDVLRAMTQVVPHACTLLLHDPLLRVNEESFAYCEAACNGVVRVLRLIVASEINVCKFPAAMSFIMATTGKTLVRRLELTRRQISVATNVETPEARASASSTTPSTSVYNPGALSSVGPFCSQIVDEETPGAAPFFKADTESSTAGLGGFANSEKEQDLRSDIDLVFQSLCQYGQTWPIGMRQAQGLARQLGVDVVSPELLVNGIFTDKAHPSVHMHMYHQGSSQGTSDFTEGPAARYEVP